MRIVSLLPSATEIVCQLGLGESLVGVTHECDHPPFVTGLPKVTRTLIPTDAFRTGSHRPARLYRYNRDVELAERGPLLPAGSPASPSPEGIHA